MENYSVCNHISTITEIKTSKNNVCEECIEGGTAWVHLRTCQTCGITLCCDSSPMQHMSHHCKSEFHPVVISSEPEERWLYCYVDDQVVDY
ncbi:UBP-type zinc finger domain-containing protein [Pedobacter terrae]|uniref:UBP-type zinc finger domain-containing protein n=1 Tax=Pedobacter terrae TaxID=405671 RepID=UPI000B86BA66|nr:UBP-type zinc finger domain-containing protein [Pedobacter terrae]